MEVRSESGDDLLPNEGTNELIKVKISIQREDMTTIRAVRMELSSEEDLFFHYIHYITEQTFPGLREDQGLMIQFTDYIPQVLVPTLTSCISEPKLNLAVFTMSSATEARLNFFQNLYKKVEILNLSLERCSSAYVQAQISYRYNIMKQNMIRAKAQLVKLTNVVKTKNPSLLLTMQQHFKGGSDGFSGSGSGSIHSSAMSMSGSMSPSIAGGSVRDKRGSSSSVGGGGVMSPNRYSARGSSSSNSSLSPISTAPLSARSESMFEYAQQQQQQLHNGVDQLHAKSPMFSLTANNKF